MKLRNKTLIVISSIFILCLAVGYFTSSSVSNYIILCAFPVITGLLIYGLVVRRIEQLNENMLKFQMEEMKPQPDEIQSITSYLDLLEKDLQTHRDNFSKKVHEQTRELEEQNTLLQQAIHEHELAERKLIRDRECLTRIARYDDLTTLPNRVFFNEVLNKSISHAKRHQKILSVLLIDLDKFVEIHEKIGEAQSNHILKEIGRRFTNVLRSEDILAKLDGEEFIVLLNDIKQSKFASAVAEKLLQVCAYPMKIDEQEFSITASIGIGIYPGDGESLEEILQNVDDALFKAKHQGGNMYQFFRYELDVEAREYIQIESALKNAMQNNELALFYQPKLHIRKGKIVGLETLMRWEHPTLGIISPSKFIPLAEECGLIMQLGEWALRKACRTNKYWQDEGYEHVTVSVNLSPKQFYHPDMAKTIANVLKSTGLSPNYLELEITENTVMGNVEMAEKILREIKAIGVNISIDHFGSGYTSISYLKLFPINAIKVDQNFIKGITTNPNDSAITNAIIALAHTLGLEVVAEGVETAEQVQQLSNFQCDMIQGYFLSHPVSAHKIILQLRKLSEVALL